MEAIRKSSKKYLNPINKEISDQKNQIKQLQEQISILNNEITERQRKIRKVLQVPFD